jgi:ABC-type phosphate transport system substrate-binding protein
MSALKQKLARIGATAGVLAASTVAMMAVGGATASSAFACVTPGTALTGQGSSLQKIAQGSWTGSYGCPETPVTYNSTSSGNGLTEFGFKGGALNTGLAFIASDDGPSGEAIGLAETAASGVEPVIIPVAETSIAVVINPPTENTTCKLVSNSTHGLTYAQLGQIFGGSVISTWKQLKEAGLVEGEGCTGAIERVVRKEGSGTTYQFKNYLAVLEENNGGAAMPCSLEGIKEDAEGNEESVTTNKTWKHMRFIGAKNASEEEPPNTTWPQPTSGKLGFCSGTTKVTPQAGGGKLAEYVAKTNGTIGYASLPDAKNAKAEFINLQDVTTPKFASPLSGTASNCGTRVYTVPTPGRPKKEPGGVPAAESGIGVVWSQTFGASPTISGGLYPLCTLTYDVAWTDYEGAGYTSGTKVGNNVQNYMEFVLGTTGQSLLGSNFYQALPSTPSEPEHNVLGAALLSTSKIN